MAIFSPYQLTQMINEGEIRLFELTCYYVCINFLIAKSGRSYILFERRKGDTKSNQNLNLDIKGEEKSVKVEKK